MPRQLVVRLILPRLLGLVCFAVLASPPSASSQERGSLVGTIVDQQTNLPLAGAVVSVSSAGLITQADSDGSFAFPNVPAASLSLRFEARGYSGIVDEVKVSPREVAFLQVSLLPVEAMLEAIMVLGERSGDTRGRLRSESALQSEGRTEAHSAADLLAQRMPGVEVIRGGSDRANAGRILIRGASSMSLDNEPVLLLDGVRIGGGRALQILSEIPSSMVERIRVLRGPAAGSTHRDSANGVVLVETKRQGDGGNDGNP